MKVDIPIVARSCPPPPRLFSPHTPIEEQKRLIKEQKRPIKEQKRPRRVCVCVCGVFSLHIHLCKTRQLGNGQGFRV